MLTPHDSIGVTLNGTFSLTCRQVSTYRRLMRAIGRPNIMFVKLILTRTMIALGLLLPLSGCGAIIEGVESSSAPPVSKFEVKDLDTFRIIDDPQEGLLIISRGPGALTSAALTTIFSFGIKNPDSPEPIMESAAVGYLKSTRTYLKITDLAGSVINVG